MPKMLDIDTENERILKTYIEGPTVYDLVCQDTLDPIFLEQVRDMARKAREAGLNIDYFPTNFVCQNGQLYYVDFECNPYMDQWNFENWGIRYWSRTPEFLSYQAEHP